MASNNKIKFILLAFFSLVITGWALSGVYSDGFGVYAGSDTAVAHETPTPPAAAGGYVGSETCAACHEEQARVFAGTKHGKLGEVESWKGKVQGCETCHGPGGKHLEDPTIVGTMISFKNRSSKENSETCLACHAGKESHNNYRRGEHWRNDVGCTDCHSPHGSPLGDSHADSQMFISKTSIQNPGIASTKMLKMGEPQLCMTCHNETKSQFTKPFHHKVLEGTMKCSDCHNAHGGFESKQTKLAVGADVACIKCHANKQGPFVYEHAPLKLEGCTACHIPHGSSNPKMLKRPQVRQLCFECHTGITEEVSPQAPSLHNQAQVRYTQCTVCHSAIHGSNSSSVFFR